MEKRCAVVGAGIAGLASAIRIAAKGYKVDVYEANNYIGGKIREKREKGYRFDMGPSVLTQPQLIDELFKICGKNPRDYFSYKRLDPTFKYFFEDGTTITAHADTEKFGDEIARKTSDSKESFRKYLKDIAKKYEITKDVFIENSIHKVRHLLNIRTAIGIANMKKIEAFTSMNEGNMKYFKDPKSIQLFNNYASYVGSNPYIAPATLNVIQHLEISLGTFMPEKGIYSIINVLAKLAEEMGVSFHLNSYVEEIVVKDKIAVGIKKDNKFLPYHRVISNMDIYHTYNKLLPGQKKPKLVLSQPKSSSVIAFYWGINKKHDQLKTHNMIFSKKGREEYNAVFKDKNISDDPTTYICITSKIITDDAPEGCENWFVLVTAPNLQGQDWEEIVQRTRKNIIHKINKVLQTDLEKHIEIEEFLSPEKIEERYFSAFGSIYGNSSNNRFAAFLRHPNFSKRIKNLYFVGGSVHPGAGVPMCLNSAKIMDKLFK